MKEIEEHLLNYGIAIIGMAGRFPGANTIHAFWENIKNGTESIQFFSDSELAASGLSEKMRRNPNYVAAKGILDDIAGFDASFFHINPREAELIDPQQRIFLECAWEVCENAGYDPQAFLGRIGTFASVSKNTYLMFNLMTCPELYEDAIANQVLIANDKDYVSTRTAYKLNLRGPCITVQTACSSSLVAVHLACQSLMSGECEMAIAGGISIDVPHKAGYLYQPGSIFSPDGHCRVFDANAKGTVFGQGGGLVMLKPLARAIEDRDTIHAVIRSSAVNNDGSNKTGFTAPSVEGQTEVIADAIALAQIDPKTISFIEAHGTGTALGDPIEVEALKLAFAKFTTAEKFCALGSVKTNIGHLNVASGIVGLIKAALSLENNAIPPSLHFEKPNPNIDFDHGPFYVSEGHSYKEDSPRRAGVSSFGIGGTNAHIILEQSPLNEIRDTGKEWQLIILSGRSLNVLEKMKAQLAAYMERYRPRLEDIAFTLQIGRRSFSHRSFVVCRNEEDALIALRGKTSAAEMPICRGSIAEDPNRSIVFLFPENKVTTKTSQALYESEAAYRHTYDQCKNVMQYLMGITKADFLFEDKYKALSLFAFEYSLAHLWLSWGIEPKIVLGEGIGEYVAACIAGIFSLKEALQILIHHLGLQASKMDQMLTFKAPKIPVISCFTGSWITEKEWSIGHHPIASEKQGQALHLVSSPSQLLLEVGLGERLVQFAYQHKTATQAILASLSERTVDLEARSSLLTALGNLWLAGFEPKWALLHQTEDCKRIPLPTYPFEHKRYWIDRREQQIVEKTSDAIQKFHNTVSRNVLEQEIAKIFATLLGIENVGLRDDFFDLGGHSLLGAQLLAAMKEKFGLTLSLHALFDAPTVEDIATLVERSISPLEGGVLQMSQKNDVKSSSKQRSHLVEQDLKLDNRLQPQNSFSFSTDPQSIFLTGATGFLGSYILDGLLENTNATVYCLVRDVSSASGLARIEKLSSHYGLLDPSKKHRIQIVLGDLSKPKLGISDREYEQLANEVHSIYHCGAHLSFIDPYRHLSKINVEGTRRVIELACQGRTKHIHHVSSIAAYDSDKHVGLQHADEDLSLEESWGFHSGYDETKWVSEMLIAEAGKRGIPVTIYRPGNISGDSRTGVCSATDLIGIMIRGCIGLGAAPANDDFVDVVPIDYVSKALVHLSLQPGSIKEKYNLVNPQPSRWIDLVRLMQNAGYKIDAISFDAWCEQLRVARQQNKENVLIPLLPMFDDRPLFSNRRYGCKKTIEGLQGSGIYCRAIDAPLFNAYIQHLNKEGVLIYE